MNPSLRFEPDIPEKAAEFASLMKAQGASLSESLEGLFTRRRSTPHGLSTAEATRRLKLVGPNLLKVNA